MLQICEKTDNKIQYIIRIITAEMKKALKEILTYNKGGLIYQISILEKENQIGLFFNQRLFFLLEGHHIGYLSQVKINDLPSTIDFQKTKSTVLIQNIKNVVLNKELLSIKFNAIDQNKKIEKSWLLRMENSQLAQQWHDILKKQKDNFNSSKVKSHIPFEKQKQKQKQKEIIHEKPLLQSEVKKFQINKEYGVIYSYSPNRLQESQMNKPKVELKEIGTQISPKSVIGVKRTFKDEGTGITPKQSQKSLIKHPIVKPNNSDIQNSREDSSIGKDKAPSLRQRSKQKNQRSNESLNKSSRIKHQSPSQRNANDEDQLNQNHIKITESKIEAKPQKKQQIGSRIKKPIVISSTLSNKKYLGEDASKIEELSPPKRSYYQRTSKVVNETSLSKQKLKSSGQLHPIQSQLSDDTSSIPDSSAFRHSKQPSQRFKELNENPSLHPMNNTQSKFKEALQEQVIAEEYQKSKSRVELNERERNLTWTYKFIKYNELIFEEFKQETEKILTQIIEEFSFQEKDRKFKIKRTKHDVYFYQVQDIQVKIAIMSLQDIASTQKPNQANQLAYQRICKSSAIKALQSQFKNYQALYQHLSNNSKLKVPLVSLCEYKGFLALFKVISEFKPSSNFINVISEELNLLEQRSKMQNNFEFRFRDLIYPLNKPFYDQLKNEEDQDLDFDCYLIQEIDGYLVHDFLLTGFQQENAHKQKGLLLRNQLVQIYSKQKDKLRNVKEKGKQSSSRESIGTTELEVFSKNVLKAIAAVIPEMDSLSIYFITPLELSNYLHSYGINIRYLGYLYLNVKTAFVKQYLMTEMAGRCCKGLFRKTLQDIIFEESGVSEQAFNLKIMDLLNCILGTTYETAAIWKLLSIHCQSYFSCELDINAIHKGNFLISLAYHCRLKLDWHKIKPDEAFKTNDFLNENNFSGLKSHHKCFEPIYNPEYVNIWNILNHPENVEGFNNIVSQLNLESQLIPNYLQVIQPKIRKYLAYFINPERSMLEQYQHLQLFIFRDEEMPSREGISLMLMEIKWHLKLKKRAQYIKGCDEFIKYAAKYFNDFHPIYSELYDLFSAYHLTNAEYEDAITFAKSSLVNILKICGTNHQKTSECYYHLALCYIKANRKEEAMSHIKKSKFIFENNHKTNTIPYAIMSLKLGLLHLNQNQVDACIESVDSALEILQKTTPPLYQNQICEGYEMLGRCFELQEDVDNMRLLSKDCYNKLLEVKNPLNLEKVMKIFLFSFLSNFSPENASNYLDLISLMPLQVNTKSYAAAYDLLRKRIQQGDFLKNITFYFDNFLTIEKHIRQNNGLNSWRTLSEIYDRDTIFDFISFTEEILYFLGEGYVTGSLREAL